MLEHFHSPIDCNSLALKITLFLSETRLQHILIKAKIFNCIKVDGNYLLKILLT
jgi:hypothetical protein